MPLPPDHVKSNKMFGGWVRKFKHTSSTLGCDMVFSVYYPPAANDGTKVPVIYYLSGLGCSDDNVMQKSGIQRKAAEHQVAIVAPDTSPRGLNVEGSTDSYDFGEGAGFYLNATVPKWKNWQMHDYVVLELPKVVVELGGLDTSNAAITGHSMGGHGAIVLGLKHPDKYKAISAFAPIVNPCDVPWGQKALSGYLGNDNKDAWKQWDATQLARGYSGPRRTILVDQGTADDFLDKQLQPDKLVEAAAGNNNLEIKLRKQDGYDHSYFTVASLVDDHLEHLCQALKA